jgi:hypothetical protein
VYRLVWANRVDHFYVIIVQKNLQWQLICWEEWVGMEILTITIIMEYMWICLAWVPCVDLKVQWFHIIPQLYRLPHRHVHIFPLCALIRLMHNMHVTRYIYVLRFFTCVITSSFSNRRWSVLSMGTYTTQSRTSRIPRLSPGLTTACRVPRTILSGSYKIIYGMHAHNTYILYVSVTYHEWEVGADVGILPVSCLQSLKHLCVLILTIKAIHHHRTCICRHLSLL